ncbi:type II secretion system inner membrane protein GspF [Pseudomonas sp. RC10]|uniref:type II secretion system inner membrane protein GspF n=1 Tax=Pseudomonas bambusae TaxID=3139142 RepID=UPI0031395B17
MASFSYEAHDSAGRRQRGQQEAQSARHARQLLRDKGLLPVRVCASNASSQPGSPTVRRQGLSTADLTLLTLQLSTLIQAGLPLEEALHAVEAQAEKRQVGQLVAAIRARVTEGYDLASALGAYPRAFPDLYRATVAAGERSGHLGHVLERLASYTEARQLSRQKIQLALVYPAILLCASLAIVGFLLGYVVPDVVKVFIDSGQPLPLLTDALIAVSTALRDYGGVLIGLFAGLAMLARWGLQHPELKRRCHSAFLRMPVMGRVIKAMEAARFASTLAILGKSAVPLVDALHVSAAVIGNVSIRERMLDVARRVREGETLTRSLERGGDIPPLMLHMIASGERAGELDHMLERAAQQQEKSLAASIALIVSLFEPAMLVIMGGLVLMIVLAILMPILNLNQLVH